MKIDLSDEDIQDFRNEAQDLLELAEHHLLAIENGGDFGVNYDAIFRVFHSIKGTAGAVGWAPLQNHYHQIETQFLQCKQKGSITKAEVSYFLGGLDASRVLLNQGSIDFDYTIPDDSAPPTAANESSPSAANVQGAAPASQPATPTPAPAAPAAHNPTALSTEEDFTKQIDSDDFFAYIIDDEPELVEILSDILIDSGFTVQGFTRPEAALEAIRQKKPDLVVTDMRMPGMSGLDLLKKVQEIDPDLTTVFVSGQLTKEMIIEAVAHGIFGVIEKPFTETQVVSVCSAGARKTRLTRLLDRTVSLALYQFSTLEEMMRQQGKSEVSERMGQELQAVLKIKRKLKSIRQKA